MTCWRPSYVGLNQTNVRYIILSVQKPTISSVSLFRSHRKDFIHTKHIYLQFSMNLRINARVVRIVTTFIKQHSLNKVLGFHKVSNFIQFGNAYSLSHISCYIIMKYYFSIVFTASPIRLSSWNFPSVSLFEHFWRSALS